MFEEFNDNPQMTLEIENRLRGYIARNKWIWARTYPTCPHEYIVRGKCTLSDQEFVYFVECQRRYGRHERWGKYNNQYLYIDGYKYWTMGDLIPNTIIMNRQKLFDEYDNIAPKLLAAEPTPERVKTDAVLAEVLSHIVGSVCEIGCGKGELHEGLMEVDSFTYIGLEPSPVLYKAFTQRHPGYHALNKAFEEIGDQYMQFENVVALYGTASYIMLPYLKKLASEHRGLFLMFYKPGITPEAYTIGGLKMHHFPHTVEELATLFADCSITSIGDYNVVYHPSIQSKHVKPLNTLF